ncbi:MAG: murein biosynthesis integral membrane protein MurJ, partial [Chloroflexota bacterium]
SYTVVIMLIAGGLTLVLARPLIDLIVAPGLDPEQAALAANLTRLLLLSPLLLGIGIAFKGMLEAQERFALSAYAPVFYNLGIIFGAIALVPAFGVYGLALGVVLGASLHAGIQWAGLAIHGTRLRLHFDRTTEGLADVLRLMGPRVLGQAAFQINFIVMTNFASREGASTVGALNYAFQIFMLPHGVIALSVSTVIFPLMARQVQLGDLAAMKQTLSRALAPLVYLSLPAAIGLYAFREPIVQLLFQFGNFDAESTRLVADALALFAVGLIGYVITEAIARAFYALHDTRTPVIVAISAVGFNVVMSWILVQAMGYTGLALSLSIASTIEAVVLAVILARRTGKLPGNLTRSIAKSVIGALALVPFAVWAGDQLSAITDPANGRSAGMYAIFLFGVATTAGLYFAVTYLIGSDQVRDFGMRVPLLRDFVRRRYGA